MSLDFENLIKAESANCTAGLSARAARAASPKLAFGESDSRHCSPPRS